MENRRWTNAQKIVGCLVLLAIVALVCGASATAWLYDRGFLDGLTRIFAPSVQTEVEDEPAASTPNAEEANTDSGNNTEGVPTNNGLAVIEYVPPQDAFPLVSNDVAIGVAWVINHDEPEEVAVPFQGLVVFAGGNYDVDDESFAAAEWEINISYTFCLTEGGCTYTLSNQTAGHVAITVMYPSGEDPNVTLQGAVTNGFNGSNCGNEGCTTVYLNELGGETMTFTDASEASSISVTAPKYSVQVGQEGALPDDAEVVLLNGAVVGHTYYLSGESPQYVSVPEGFLHGTIIQCPSGCTVAGEEVSDVAVLYGRFQDGSTPEDRNWTAMVTAEDMDSILVVMIYNANVDSFIPDGTAPVYIH